MLLTLSKIFRFLIPLVYFSMADGDPPLPPAADPPASDPNEGFKNLLKRHENDARAAAQLLYQENHQYRAEIRDLQKEVDRIRKQVPADGAVILGADEAALWQKYQTLGKPEEIESVKAENATIKRGQLLSQVAEAHKYKVGVLSTLAGDLDFEIKDVNENGQKRKVAFVKIDGQDKALPDYAKEKWADFLPSLEQPTPPLAIGTQTRRVLPNNQQQQQVDGQKPIVRF